MNQVQAGLFYANTDPFDPATTVGLSQTVKGRPFYHMLPPQVRAVGKTKLQGQTVKSRIEESLMNQLVIKIFDILAMLGDEGGDALKTAAGIPPSSVVSRRLDRLVAAREKIYRPNPCKEHAPPRPKTTYTERMVNQGVKGINEMTQSGLLEFVCTAMREMVEVPIGYKELEKEILGESPTPKQQTVWSGDMGSQMVLRNLTTKAYLAKMSSVKEERHLGLIVHAVVRRCFTTVDPLHAFRLNGNNMAWRALWSNLLSGLCQYHRNSFKPEKVISNGRDHLDYLSQVATALILHVLKSILQNIEPEVLLKTVPGSVGKNGKTKFFDIPMLFELFTQETEKGGECRQHWVNDALKIILPLLDADGPGVKYGDAGLLLDVLFHCIPLFNAVGKWNYSQNIARLMIRLQEASPRIQIMLMKEICVAWTKDGPLHCMGDTVESQVQRAKAAPTTTRVGMDRHVQSGTLTSRAASALGMYHQTLYKLSLLLCYQHLSCIFCFVFVFVSTFNRDKQNTKYHVETS